MQPNALGVKRRLAATETHIDTPTPNGQVSASTPCWTCRVPRWPDTVGINACYGGYAGSPPR